MGTSMEIVRMMEKYSDSSAAAAVVVDIEVAAVVSVVMAVMVE